jgi:hypothetical protein
MVAERWYLERVEVIGSFCCGCATTKTGNKWLYEHVRFYVGNVMLSMGVVVAKGLRQ